MLGNVKVNFPELKVDVSMDFVPGINLIEERNGYGKTTVLNTILSVFTGKFGTGPIPNGTASVSFGNKQFLLSKGNWVGADEPNRLARYVMPGTFFDLSTPDQRAAIVALLGIDKESFMKKSVPNWTDTLKKEINAKLKFNEGKVDEILEEIVRLKSKVLAYEADPVIERDNSKEIEDAYGNLVAGDNLKRLQAIEHNSKVTAATNENQRKLAEAERQLESMRAEWTATNSNPVCKSCGQQLPNLADSLAKIEASAKAKSEEIRLLKAYVPEAKMDIPDPLPYLSINEKAEKVGIVLDVTSEEEYQRKRDYVNAKVELAEKEFKLRELQEVKDKETLASIEKTEKEFTKFLETQIGSLGLEIELFKTQKNGETKESFLISENGIPYAELSNGRKILVQFKLACAFADKLGLDFVLLDEAGTLSKDTLAEIVLASKGKQVIIARATPFAKKDLK